MEWTPVISSVLAGGLAGQLTVAFLNRRKDFQVAELKATFDSKREFHHWLRQERYKASIELINLVSSHHSRTEFSNWPDEIRSACVRIHMLDKSGTAPQALADAMQKVFQMALNKKMGRIKGNDNLAWHRSLREEVRILRELLAEQLHTLEND